MSLLPHGHQSGMFIEAPIDAVADCLVVWGNDESVNRGTTVERATLPLERAWDLVAQRQFTPGRALLIPCANAWTAFFDNHKYEWLAAAELYVICLNMRVNTCFFSCNDQAGSEHCGSAQFNHCRYGGGDPPVKQRQVMLLKENGWRFQQTGDPLSFEKLDAYTLPKKRDRLNADVLRAYGEALAIPFWDPEAYGQDVAILRWGEKSPTDTDSALKKLMRIFGRPSLIMDRHGTRRPPA